jgi:hypothetical protein
MRSIDVEKLITVKDRVYKAQHCRFFDLDADEVF